jgi:hypothetical protein
MGMYATGTICFGLLIDEDEYDILPWNSGEVDGEEEWWTHVNGYMPPFQVYDENGRLPGITDEQVSEYWSHYFAWLRENPLPIDLVNYCHCDYPQYILAIPGSIKNGDAGNPTKLGRDDLTINPESVDSLLTFFSEYGIVVDEDKLGWWLSGCYH